MAAEAVSRAASASRIVPRYGLRYGHSDRSGLSDRAFGRSGTVRSATGYAILVAVSSQVNGRNARVSQVLHRRRLGRPGRRTILRGHESGDRGGHCGDLPRRSRGRGSRSRGRAPGLRGLLADDPRGAACAARADRPGLPAPVGRPGAGHHRGNGSAAGDGVAADAGPRRAWPLQGRDGRAEVVRVRARAGVDANRARADRRHRDDHALELAGEPDRLQGRAGYGRRMHDGAEAERDGAALGAGDRRDHGRGRRAERGVQPGERGRTRPSAPRSHRTPGST